MLLSTRVGRLTSDVRTWLRAPAPDLRVQLTWVKKKAITQKYSDDTIEANAHTENCLLYVLAFLAVCDPPSTQRINGLFNSTGQSKDPRDEGLVRAVCKGSGSSCPLTQTVSSPRASGFLLTTEGQLCKSSNPFVPPWRQCPSVSR